MRRDPARGPNRALLTRRRPSTSTPALRFALSALLLLVVGAARAADEPATEGVPFEGRLVTIEGSPVPGARVEILHAGLALDPFWHGLIGEPPAPLEAVETDEDGRFAILQPANASFVVEISAEGFVGWTFPMDTPVEPPRVELPELPPDLRDRLQDIHLFRDAGLPVHVVDPEGRPVAGARVLVHGLLWYGGSVVTAGEDGRTRAPRVAALGPGPTPVTLWVLPPADRADLAASSGITVQDDEAVVRLGAAAPRTLEVRRADGAPAAGVVVILDESDRGKRPMAFTVTGEDGRAEVPHPLSGEPSRLHLVAPDDSWALVELPRLDAAPDPADALEPVVVTLAPPSVREIRVVTAGGEPMEGVFAFWWPDRDARTGADGSLVLRVPRGREATQPHTLMLHAPGYGPESFVLDVAFLRGADEPVEIRMTPSAPRPPRASRRAGSSRRRASSCCAPSSRRIC